MSYEKSSCKIINNLIVLKTDQLAFASFYERLRSSVLLFVQFRFKTVRATYMELKMIGCTIEPHSIWCIQKCLLIWIIFYFSLSSRSVHLKRGRAMLRVTFSRRRWSRTGTISTSAIFFIRYWTLLYIFVIRNLLRIFLLLDALNHPLPTRSCMWKDRTSWSCPSARAHFTWIGRA